MNQPLTPEQLAADERFQRFCAHPHDAAERHYWQQRPDISATTLIEAQQLVAQLAFLPAPEATEAAWEQLSTRLTDAPTRTAVRRTLPKTNRRRWLGWSVAASLLLIAGLTGWFFMNDAPAWTTHRTAYNEVQTLDLADGTTVHLNANSELRISDDLATADRRMVELTGEAFFDVAHAANRPFTLATQRGDVRVLGTSFSVQQRRDELEVILVEGKVKLDLDNEQTVHMTPGQRVRYHDGMTLVETIDTDGTAAWRNGRMHFRNETVARVLDRVRHDFGWQIEVADAALLERRITAQIPQNDPEILFEALAALYDLTLERSGANEYLLK